MSDPQKTVFVSYRRNVSSFIARAIFMELRQHDYDVFMDVQSIDSGTFDTVILNQIAARAHFLIILTPGTLERCVEPDDWIRKEIETAIELKRNVVPLLIGDFKFTANEQQYLTGKLADLTRYNAISIPHDYFEEAMERLRTRFLKVPVVGSITPAPSREQVVIQQKIDEVASQPAPTEAELGAEEYFTIGYRKYDLGDYQGSIEAYNEAIRLNPQYVQAIHNRGFAYQTMGDFDKALKNYELVLQLNPNYPLTYYNRGGIYYDQGDYEQCIADYNEALRLDPDHAEGYSNRGEAYFALGQYQAALEDFKKSAALKNGLEYALAGMAIAHYMLGETQEAHTIWKKALILKNAKYRDADWVGKHLNWDEKLVEAARKLIAEL